MYQSKFNTKKNGCGKLSPSSRSLTIATSMRAINQKSTWQFLSSSGMLRYE